MLHSCSSEAGDEPLTLKGKFIDLFDPELPVLREKIVNPGEQAFLFDISRVKNKKQPQVLAAASRQYDEQRTAGSYSFVAKSPAQTSNVMRILLPKKPKSVKLNGTATDAWQWNENDQNTMLLKFENDPDGVKVDIKW